METKVVTIDKQIAEMLLAMNTNNRPLSISRAKRLADAIRRGEWQLNGDSIRVSETGVLLDGQHRLMAIVLADMPVQTLLIEGLPDDVFNTIDTNAMSRTASDILAIKGEKNYVVLAASAALMYFYKRFNVPYNMQASLYPTPRQIQETVEEFKELHEAVDLAVKLQWCSKYTTKTLVAFCLCVFMRKDKEKALSFFNKLESGAELNAESPILALRNRLILDHADKTTKVNKNYKLALMFKAFKHYLTDTSVKCLKVRLSGDSQEKTIFNL